MEPPTRGGDGGNRTAMNHADNIIDIRRPVEFSIEDRWYTTADRRQRAIDLLRLAGVDPTGYELWEIRRHRPLPWRYQSDAQVLIRSGARFVAVRKHADVR
jgi:hypothetical protein